MNKRRWIAVIIAAGLFICSGVFSLLAPAPTDEETSLDGLNALLYGSNELQEHTLMSGDTSKRILRLSLDGTIMDSSDGLFSTETYDHQLFLEELRAVQEDPTIKGDFV
jgi:protease-4